MKATIVRIATVLSATSAAFYGFAFLSFFVSGCLGYVPEGDCDQARLAMFTAQALGGLFQWGIAAAFCLAVEDYLADCADND